MTDDPTKPVHCLKTVPEPFNAVWNGQKRHEVRRNDRGFTLADLLVLREWDEKAGVYTGRAVFAVPTYITPGGVYDLPKGVVVMSISVIGKCKDYTP